MRAPKLLRKIYFKYFAKIQFHTVHLRGKLNTEEKKYFNSHLFKIDLKDISKYFSKNSQNILEIGFGDGYHLLTLAKSNPEKLFLGVELDQISIYKLLKKIDKEKLNNIYLLCLDARVFVDKQGDDFFEKIYIPFPDPWPKKREQRRRLLTTSFLSTILRKIKRGGELVIATDIDSYKQDIENNLHKLQNTKKIFVLKKEEKDFPNNIFNSKFAMKAKREGRNNTLYSIKIEE